MVYVSTYLPKYMTSFSEKTENLSTFLSVTIHMCLLYIFLSLLLKFRQFSSLKIKVMMARMAEYNHNINLKFFGYLLQLFLAQK